MQARGLRCIPRYQDALTCTMAAALYRAMRAHQCHPRRIEFEVRCGVLQPRIPETSLLSPATIASAATTAAMMPTASSGTGHLCVPVSVCHPVCTPGVLRACDKANYAFRVGVSGHVMRSLMYALLTSRLVRHSELHTSHRSIVVSVDRVRHIYDVCEDKGVTSSMPMSVALAAATATASDGGDAGNNATALAELESILRLWPPYHNTNATLRQSQRKRVLLFEDVFVPTSASDWRVAVSLERPLRLRAAGRRRRRRDGEDSSVDGSNDNNDNSSGSSSNNKETKAAQQSDADDVGGDDDDDEAAMAAMAATAPSRVVSQQRRRMHVGPYFALELTQTWELADVRRLRWRTQLEQQRRLDKGDGGACATPLVAPSSLVLPLANYWRRPLHSIEVEVDVERVWRDWRRMGGGKGVGALSNLRSNAIGDDGGDGDDDDARGRARARRRLVMSVTPMEMMHASRDPFLCGVAQDLLTLVQFVSGSRRPV